MRFIHVWSYSCANYLMLQLKENHEKRRVYYYGFQIVVGSIVKGILLVTLALLFQSLIPTLIILLAFAALRVSAGGYHMDTYGKCIATSLAMFLAAGAIVQYTHQYWGMEYIIAFIVISLAAGIIIVYKYAPSDTPNKPITKPEEIKKFRKQSFIYLAIWTLVVTLILYFRIGTYNMYVVALCFGMLLELFSVTPAGYRFFDRISGAHH